MKSEHYSHSGSEEQLISWYNSFLLSHDLFLNVLKAFHFYVHIKIFFSILVRSNQNHLQGTHYLSTSTHFPNFKLLSSSKFFVNFLLTSSA